MLQALGASPPVLPPTASATIFEGPTGGLTPRRSLRTEASSSRVHYLLPPA